MALVEQWTREEARPAGRRISTCAGSWHIESGAGGQQLLVLRTFGSANRKDKGTPSQVLHLDHSSAAALAGIIAHALPGLADS